MGRFQNLKSSALGEATVSLPSRDRAVAPGGREVEIPLLLGGAPSRRKSSSMDPVWCLIDREAGSTGSTPVIPTLGSTR